MEQLVTSHGDICFLNLILNNTLSFKPLLFFSFLLFDYLVFNKVSRPFTSCNLAKDEQLPKSEVGYYVIHGAGDK